MCVIIYTYLWKLEIVLCQNKVLMDDKNKEKSILYGKHVAK